MKKIMTGVLIFLFGTITVQANEYSTDETIHYALTCMDRLGGQTDENLYTCVCRYDGIRKEMTFSDYEEGVTFERNKAMPGEKGGAVRDNRRGEAFYKQLLKVREKAYADCPVVKHVKLIKPTNKK